MNAYQPTRPAARFTSGLAGAAIGFAVLAGVVQGMSTRSAGQSLGQFMATQRAVATSPMAVAPQAVAPTAPAAAPALPADAV
jgi:hypothetical protein